MTGKRRIYFDGKEILKVQKFTYEFSYSFSIDNHYLSLVQLGPTNYDLRIDNMAFNTIINERKKNNKIEKRKKEGKEIIKSILDDEVDNTNTKTKNEYLDFDSNNKNKITIKSNNNKGKKDSNDADFFKIDKKDKEKSDFDVDGFDFEDNSKITKKNEGNEVNSKKLEDVFDFGF